MGKIVQIKPNFTGVMLIPSMRGIDAGQQFTLTDAEYAALPSSVSRTVTLIQSGVTDPVRSSGVPQSLSETLAQAKAYADGAGAASVNGRTGAVVLTADDTPDGTSNKAYSVAEKAKVTGAAQKANNLSDLVSLSSGEDRLAASRYAPMRRWNVALANRHAAPATAIVIGDSVTEGQGASSKANRFLSKMQTAMRSRLPSNGSTGGASDCFMPSWRAVSASDSTWAAADYTASGAMYHDTYGPFGMHSLDFGAAAASRTWTFTGTKAVLYWINVQAASFTWALDGGSTNTVNPTNALTLGSVQVYSGTSGTHTITVVAGGSTGTAIAGLQLWDGDENQGIRVLDFGHVSFTTASFLPTVTSEQTLQAAAWTAVGPALVLLELGLNDYGTNVLPATFQTNLQTIISRVKAAVTATPSFLIVIPYTPTSAQTYPWSQYVDAMYAVAAADPANVAVVDLSARLPATNVSSPALYATDALHPLNLGHATIADILATRLTAGAAGSTGALTILEASSLPKFPVPTGPQPGSGTTAAKWDHLHPRYSWEPPDHGLLGWSFDGVMAASSTTPGAGQLQMVRIHVPVASSITNVIINVVTLGATLTSGQNFMALFDSSRNLLGVTADRTTRWNTGGTTGMDEAALVGGPFAVAAGDYYVGFWSVGTTQPAIARAGNTGAINNKLSGNNSRHGTSSAGLTTTAPNPAAAITASNTAFWAAVS